MWGGGRWRREAPAGDSLLPATEQIVAGLDGNAPASAQYMPESEL